MVLPPEFDILIITLSDRAYRGEYEDTSGARIKEMTEEFFRNMKAVCKITRTILPDEEVMLRNLIIDSAGRYDIIFTSGGTGIGPRDITIEVISPMLTKEIPGIMEFIRVKYGASRSNALLSRGVSGLIGKTLIYTLPGSLRAVSEYMSEILKTLEHTLLMLYGIDTHTKS